jgi:hypothetical protein
MWGFHYLDTYICCIFAILVWFMCHFNQSALTFFFSTNNHCDAQVWWSKRTLIPPLISLCSSFSSSRKSGSTSHVVSHTDLEILRNLLTCSSPAVAIPSWRRKMTIVMLICQINSPFIWETFLFFESSLRGFAQLDYGTVFVEIRMLIVFVFIFRN